MDSLVWFILPPSTKKRAILFSLLLGRERDNKWTDRTTSVSKGPGRGPFWFGGHIFAFLHLYPPYAPRPHNKARKRAGVMRTGRGKISTERASGSSRGADMPRWIASSSSRRRRTYLLHSVQMAVTGDFLKKMSAISPPESLFRIFRFLVAFPSFSPYSPRQ